MCGKMKKGYLRTIEAIIAVVLIFIFIITIIPESNNQSKTPDTIKSLQNKIVTKIEENKNLRKNVLDYNVDPDTIETLEQSSEWQVLNTFISDNILDNNIRYDFTVCGDKDVNGETILVCAPDFSNEGDLYKELPQKSVYAKSVVIASTQGQRIFRLYLWYEV